MITLDMLMVINQLGKKIAISNQALKCKKADYSIQFLLTISLESNTQVCNNKGNDLKFKEALNC